MTNDLSSSGECRRGFTLVELLVVIAIIGVLVALLLPAIQSAREAARRTSCMNQLKQIGLAIQTHITARGVFPTGGSRWNPRLRNYVTGGTDNPGVPNGPEKQGLSWAFQILPYLEENAVHGLVSEPQLINAVIPLYYCPSRRSPGISTTAAGIGAPTAALLDYAAAHPLSGVCPDDGSGAKYDLEEIDLSDANEMFNSHATAKQSYWCTASGEPHDNSIYDGVIVRSLYSVFKYATATLPAVLERKSGPGPVKPGQVTDGFSKTLMIGEKLVRSDMYLSNLTPYGHVSWSDDRGWSDGWDLDTVRFTGFPPLSDSDELCFDPPTSGYCTGQSLDVFFFGSAHPGGINGVFADGSVHGISFDVDAGIFNGLATRNGEESIDVGQL